MTIEEALDMAKIPLDCPDADEKVKEFARLCITALEKQKPKPHIAGRCPECNANIIGYQNIPLKYCSECGQKIDRSEENDS